MKKLLGLAALALLVLSVMPNGRVHAGVNDFETTYFGIEYNLTRDSENRSALSTTETITANFVIPNQNHGIERAIPSKYDGHKVDLNIESVTDQDGNSLEYSTYQNNDNTVLRIGNASSYVIGQKTYVIKYNQRDVTKFFNDASADEFYWDTTGIQWRTPINLLDVKVRLDKSLVDHLNGNQACYFGAVNSNNKCDLDQTESGVFVVRQTDVAPGQNITVAIGFEANTFSAYQKTAAEKLFSLWTIILLISIPIGFCLLIYLSIKYHRLSFRSKEIGTVIPEYLPPKGISLTTSASIISGSKNVFAAQLIDFAVRHYIQINEVKPKSMFRAAEYEIVIKKDLSPLLSEEIEILTDIFGRSPNVGDSLELSTLKNNYTVSSRFLDNQKKLNKLIEGEYAIRQKTAEATAKFRTIAVITLVCAVIMLNPVFLTVAITAFICAYTIKPLSDKGLELARYLHGFREYISVAEQDRLKMLQSPEGAQKLDGIKTDDSARMINLYERALPYAMIFGQEKAWNKELGKYYEDASTSPNWYHGSTPLQGLAFASAVSSFSSSTSYSAPSSSSSSGSTGGGFSGGGGGGGGGGGW